MIKVGSVALQELNTDLGSLSRTLGEISELMNFDMNTLGESWRDDLYNQFVQNYRPQIKKCGDISQRYNSWCKTILQPAIEQVIKTEAPNRFELNNNKGGTSGSGTSGSGTSGSGTSGSGTSGSSTSGSSTSGRGASGRGASGRGSSGSEASGSGTFGRGASGRGSSGSGASSRGSSGRGASGRGSSGRGVSGRGASGSGTSGRGTSGSGIDNHKNDENRGFNMSGQVPVKTESTQSVNQNDPNNWCKGFPGTHPVPGTANDYTRKVVNNSGSFEGTVDVNGKVGLDAPLKIHGIGVQASGSVDVSGKGSYQSGTTIEETLIKCVVNSGDSQ